MDKLEFVADQVYKVWFHLAAKLYEGISMILGASIAAIIDWWGYIINWVIRAKNAFETIERGAYEGLEKA